MLSFHLPDVQSESVGADRRWHEFLRVDSLCVGLYRLKSGQADPQQPHGEDEVYYVLEGKATFRCGDQKQPVGAGSLLFVERAAEHRFCDIVEDLTVLVFFAPPEGSTKN